MRRDGKKRREALVFIAWVSKRGVIMIAHWREREQGGGGCGWRGQQIDGERERELG